MKRKIIPTILWMIIFAAATFPIGPISLAVLADSHTITDTWLEQILWGWRLVFMASPLVALFLGLRGMLPGTRLLDGSMRGASAITRILARIVMLVAALFTIFMWVAFQPPAGRPNVSIAFLGYTNDTSGTRLARIAVTNLNASPVFAYRPLIEVPSPTEPAGLAFYESFGGSRWHSLLGSGASDTFTIPVSTNQSPWKLTLLVYPDRGPAKVFIKGVAGISCMSIGLMPRSLRMPYDIESDWIHSEK
jgi:hypothetical protein